MRFEDKYLDVLQNIEFGIVMTYREYPEMTDYDVMRVLEALIDSYAAEKIGREPRKQPTSEVERVMFENVRRMCEWRLGRKELDEDSQAEEEQKVNPITVDELLLCLKKILKSVNMWNEEFGAQGYLKFVSQYV